ncbi:SsDNA binding protein [Rasamsonia emersonii CBS 393.64]|uniref:SsDNA binding protein n=1 Tax=Rasamsonia emersonii (strain ATCC 16479 / CBS 393.64 / IMI 116815) TaxID=1408163 RepID=A0A0F4Z3U9_RASE3|nr:SsDNA binding protein [Rasamsonia emersonii CBS 393.64]KKA25189.1 SsDNA binding protein [Rasamsonia emersonii CBS 393.64]
MQALRPLLRARAAAPARGLSAARSFSSSPSHSVARLIITGRLAFEPELQTTSTGREVVRTLVYVEGDATLRAYEDAEGRKNTSLHVVQRNLEVLRRPYSGSRSESYSSEESQQ